MSVIQNLSGRLASYGWKPMDTHHLNQSLCWGQHSEELESAQSMSLLRSLDLMAEVVPL